MERKLVYMYGWRGDWCICTDGEGTVLVQGERESVGESGKRE
jgi:hypothetical protein